VFNHDFKCENNKIINFQFIKESWDTKKHNFVNYVKSEEIKIFINFSENPIIDDYFNFLSLLKDKYDANLDKIYICIFSKNTATKKIKNVQIINLDNDYSEWFLLSNYSTHPKLFKEIYGKFYDFAKSIDVDNIFPIFEQTDYFKSISVKPS